MSQRMCVRWVGRCVRERERECVNKRMSLFKVGERGIVHVEASECL